MILFQNRVTLDFILTIYLSIHDINSNTKILFKNLLVRDFVLKSGYLRLYSKDFVIHDFSSKSSCHRFYYILYILHLFKNLVFHYFISKSNYLRFYSKIK